MLTPEDLRVLETIIDRANLRSVVDALATIAHEKAEHIRSNWQDRVTAAPWNRAGNELEKTAERLSRIGV